MARSDPRVLTADDVTAGRPVYVVWELTLRCDQACRHCGSRAGLARRSELDTAEALDLVRQMSVAGVREVTLIGGESYLRPDWLDIIKALADGGIRVSLVTGGRRLSTERARAAREAGVYSVSISVDGLQPTHDALRAVPGSWQGAMDAIAAVGATGAHATVNTQINARNEAELEALGDELARRGVRTWQLQLTTPMGRAADQARLILQPWQLALVMPRLAAIAKGLRPRGCLVMAANNLGYFGPFEADLRPGGHWIGCTGGRWSLGVQSDGTIKGCSSLPTDPYGDLNVRDLPLSEILQRSTALEGVRTRTVDDLWGFCHDCYYAESCLGGCVWTAHTLFGRSGNMPYCHHRVLELRDRGLRERLEPATAAPGRAFDHGTWTLLEEPWTLDPDPTAKRST